MTRSEEHTSELQSQFRISYAVFCLKKKKQKEKQKEEKEKKKERKESGKNEKVEKQIEGMQIKLTLN